MTGSQTTKVRIEDFGRLSRIAATAEAPRRHVPQVGESMRMIRGRSAAALNESRKAGRVAGSSLATAGEPARAFPDSL